MSQQPRRQSSNSSQLRIRAFPTVPDEASVNRIWEQLKSAIKDIQNKNNFGLSFEELYRSTYTLIIHKYGDRLYKDVEAVVREHVLKVRDTVLAQLNNDFLMALQTAWRDHQTAMGMIRDILMYMTRVYVNLNNLPSVYHVGMTIFQTVILEYPQIKQVFLGTLLEMVRKERNGESINRTQFRDACQMLVAVGVDSVKFYYEYFQIPLMEETRQYYSREVQAMLAENVSTPIFINRVERRIDEEIKRVNQYLDASTEAEMIALLEEELITKNLQAVIDMPESGLTHMLRTDRVDEITSMYKLIKSVKSGPTVLNEVLCTYFANSGKKIVEDNGNNNAQQYIQDLINLRDKADLILREALENCTLFRNKLNTTFEDFINKNATSPEFLSLFIDDKLRRGNRGVTDQDMDLIFDKAIIIFRYLHDKDMFERYYKMHLAKRLLLSKSQSDDQERSMIQKLMMECGAQFTNKFEGMFKDITLSKTLDLDFQRHDSRKGCQIDINVRVLTAGLWPTEQENKQAQVQLPEEALLSFDIYSKFYLSKHNGRKITLQCNQGNAELSALFYGKSAMLESTSSSAQQQLEPMEASSSAAPVDSIEAAGPKKPSKPKNYILQVSTFQMVVLLKFNKRPKMSFTELASETGIPEKELQRSLIALSLGKASQRILVKEPKTKRIESADVFFVNDAFTSEHIKVKVQNISMKESEPERQETRAQVDENRRYVIEATIVRIMKTRKQLEHTRLVAEIIEQLQSRFKPNPLQIKSRIESLLERSYLARSEDDRRMYKYLA